MDQAAQAGDELFQKVIENVFNPLLQLAVVIAFLYFLYGGLMFLVNMNDPEKRADGQRHLLWGTVGLFIIVSINGIFMLLNSAVGGMFQF